MGVLAARAPSWSDVRKSNLDALGEPRGIQPNEVGDTPLLERTPRGVSNERRVLQMPAINKPNMQWSIGLGARNAKMKKSTRVGGARQMGTHPWKT